MGHLLVTNDFPPKIGGIQSYLWELWRRFPVNQATVYTTPYAGAAQFDARSALAIRRSREPVLLPMPHVVREVLRQARADNSSFVVLDPGLPIGAIGPQLRKAGLRYGVVVHGAEVAMYARAPATARMMRRVLLGADLVIAAGTYPLAEAQRCAGQSLPHIVIPPGVDPERFRPLAEADRTQARVDLGLSESGPLVVGASRLVPRKGFHRLIAAAQRIAPHHRGLSVAIAGGGRELARLERLAQRCDDDVSVRLLGRLNDDDFARLVGAADVFAVPCRDRWRGWEQEGFGMVFLEAGAAGVAVVAGDSGGVTDAVVDGVTGLVVSRPVRTAAVASAVDHLLRSPALAHELGQAARARAVAEFDYNVLAARLASVLHDLGG